MITLDKNYRVTVTLTNGKVYHLKVQKRHINQVIDIFIDRDYPQRLKIVTLATTGLHENSCEEVAIWGNQIVSIEY